MSPAGPVEARFSCAGPEETAALGRSVGQRLFPGAVVALHGGLGAGKTCFAGGVGAGMGLAGPFPSPTYAIVHSYPGLFHVDLYRIADDREVLGLGLDEQVGRDGAWIIEWPERAAWLLPAERLDVWLTGEGQSREVRMVGTGRHAGLVPKG